MKSAFKPPAYPVKGVHCGWVVKRNSTFNWMDGDNGFFTWAHDCDFFGHDISKVKSSRDECPQLCLANSECSHFSWGWDNYCFMKSAIKPTAYPTTWAGTCGKINARVWDGDDFLFIL